ncbi:MAG TPA: hypothetical protein VHA06_20995 [Candidatus Angelobacter sp.]|jgi:hypothetical protein|nr:hypothetical protein [Candidatus Angelobacter sp.]
MNACCTSASGKSAARVAKDGPSVSSPRVRRSLILTRWSLPAVILLLIPKCPACLAAYIAVGTGLSLSVAAAFYLRGLLIAVCVALILFNVLWLMRKMRTALHI